MSDRLERILASIGTPAHVDQETPRETILVLEVRRLRSEHAALRERLDALRAKVDAMHDEAEAEYRRESQSYREGQLDALELVQGWMDAALKGGGA